ncbi:MAG: type II toxin-antitoxin system HipA family toxin [Candidatus Kapabacteria bacterium]|nr:type II toxin-antitoxin system HipA family toxin [Candidatus Kapabacteria bacterium]
MINTAFVKIWGELVGVVAWDSESELASFEFDSKFKNFNWDLAPLKMPIKSNNTIFSFRELRKERNSEFNTFRGMPGLLADVLPDRFGNQLINAWLAQKGRPQNSMNPVEMLCFIGTRGMGALEFEPVYTKESKKSFNIEIDSLVGISQKILSTKESLSTNLLIEEQESIKEILKVGTSAGGARPKAVIAYNEKTGAVKSGQTNAPKGFEHWLIKLDGVSEVQLGASQGFGRVEMAYYLMAKSCGIDIMTSRLLEENGRAHFMTKRFDRDEGDIKYHIQTFCAIKHFDYNEVKSFSYEQLFQTMRELKLSYPEAEQMFRRMVFNVIARNCDDHTKNFAFRFKKEQKWELAPAYDVCYAYNPKSIWVSQHALSINGKRDNINKEDLLIVAKSINIKKAENIINEINDSVMKWKSFANQVGVSNELKDSIASTLVFF